jgi:hypothetical protein
MQPVWRTVPNGRSPLFWVLAFLGSQLHSRSWTERKVVSDRAPEAPEAPLMGCVSNGVSSGQWRDSVETPTLAGKSP